MRMHLSVIKYTWKENVRDRSGSPVETLELVFELTALDSRVAYEWFGSWMDEHVSLWPGYLRIIAPRPPKLLSCTLNRNDGLAIRS